MIYLFYFYVLFVCIMSILSYRLFIKDKKMAQQNGNEKRIKEKVLLGVTAYGGAIGSLIGRKVAHHKTDKVYFSIVIYLSLLLQIITIFGVFMITHFM